MVGAEHHGHREDDQPEPGQVEGQGPRRLVAHEREVATEVLDHQQRHAGGEHEQRAAETVVPQQRGATGDADQHALPQAEDRRGADHVAGSLVRLLRVHQDRLADQRPGHALHQHEDEEGDLPEPEGAQPQRVRGEHGDAQVGCSRDDLVDGDRRQPSSRRPVWVPPSFPARSAPSAVAAAYRSVVDGHDSRREGLVATRCTRGAGHLAPGGVEHQRGRRTKDTNRRTRSRWCSASISRCVTPGTRPATSARIRRVARHGAQNADENWTSVARSPSGPGTAYLPAPNRRLPGGHARAADRVGAPEPAVASASAPRRPGPERGHEDIHAGAHLGSTTTVGGFFPGGNRP